MLRHTVSHTILAAACLFAPAAAWAQADQSSDRKAGSGNDVDTVVVIGQRLGDLLPGDLQGEDARLGILGDKSIMEIPYSQTSMTAKQLELFGNPTLPLNMVLQNNPSIRSSSGSPMYSDFSMRGVNMNGNHMMLNGVPSLFSQFTTPPSHVIERIDITSGPNAALNGVNMSNNGTDSGATPAPGTINVVTKSAPMEDVNRLTATFSGRSSVGAYVDVARRFGSNKEWGLRVNAEHMRGELALEGAKNDTSDIFFNLDRQSADSASNLFAGYFDIRVDGGQRWFTFSGTGGKLPTAPEADTNYDFPETTKPQYGYVAAFNHDQRFGGGWVGFLNLGAMKKKGDKLNSSSALRFNDAGTFVAANVSNAQSEETENFYAQAGIRGGFNTGPLRHSVAVAVDRSWAKYWNDTNNSPTGRIGGNLYSGVAYSPQFYPLPPFRAPILQWDETNTGVTVTDVITYGQFDLLLAATAKDEDFLNALTDQTIDNNNVLPTYGLTYRATPTLSFYAGHTESFSRGAFVTNTAQYVNRGQVLDPVKASQNEVGAKWQFGGMLTTLALFDMEQQNLIDVPVLSTQFRRDADGLNRYRGIEVSSVGQLTEQVTVTAGALYLDAERERTNGGLADGKFVNGVSNWSGTVGLEYRPIDSIGLIGRAVYNGEVFIDSGANGRTMIPEYLSFDVGANYRTMIGTNPIKLSVQVANVLDRNHWMGRGGSTTFGLSMPRTFLFSLQADL